MKIDADYYQKKVCGQITHLLVKCAWNHGGKIHRPLSDIIFFSLNTQGSPASLERIRRCPQSDIILPLLDVIGCYWMFGMNQSKCQC